MQHVREVYATSATLNSEIANLEKCAATHFGRHPDAEILLGQPGLGVVLGARVLTEFGDAPGSYVKTKS